MAKRGMAAGLQSAPGLDAAFRELFNTEARLAEVLARRGGRIRHSVMDQWPVFEEFLHLYLRNLSPAGCLVLAGRPDQASRLTGIPFTGPAQARERLGLSAEGDERSRAGEVFWMCVEEAQVLSDNAPLESLFGTMFPAHAIPFTADVHAPETLEASIQHVNRLLREARPQVVVAIGADALTVLGHTTGNEAIEDLARRDEASWSTHWPPGTSMLSYPRAEAGGCRFRVVPLPALDGAERDAAAAGLTHVMHYVWA